MSSFKVKLVVYFLLLSLLPLSAAFWGFSSVAERSETRRVDARLQAGLRAALAAYQEELGTAGRDAGTLARDPVFERALASHDRATLVTILRDAPTVSVEGTHHFRVGRSYSFAARREVLVYGPRGLIGRVVVAIPLDSSLVRGLRARSGLERRDVLVLLRHGVVVGGPATIAGRVDATPGRTSTVSVGGHRYRALVAGALDEPDATLAVLSPQKLIDAANASIQRRLLLGLLASILAGALVAWIAGRAIVRTVRTLVDAAHAIARGNLRERVPVRGNDELALLGRAFNDMAGQLEARMEELDAERARLRDAVTRFGEALSATHDTEQLLRVIVETAVEATGAIYGVLVGQAGEVVQVGEPGTRELDRLELPLIAGSNTFGTLFLFAREFGTEQRLAAASLSGHAVIALENARLHRIVERQALIDGLTGLANRRQCDDALSVELARAERFDAPLSIVFCDLDDFKAVNDLYGHPAGDQVLRELAQVLLETVREADVAGRWGGEEFVLILPNTDTAGALRLAERIRVALADRAILTPEGAAVRVTASLGVASTPPAAPAALVASADAALYEAKRSGKNRVEAAPETVGRP